MNPKSDLFDIDEGQFANLQLNREDLLSIIFFAALRTFLTISLDMENSCILK